jgi:hypothetical protein
MGAWFWGPVILSSPEKHLHSMDIDNAPHAPVSWQLPTYDKEKHKKNKAMNTSEEGPYGRIRVLCWRRIDNVVRVFDTDCIPNVRSVAAPLISTRNYIDDPYSILQQHAGSLGVLSRVLACEAVRAVSCTSCTAWICPASKLAQLSQHIPASGVAERPCCSRSLGLGKLWDAGMIFPKECIAFPILFEFSTLLSNKANPD